MDLAGDRASDLPWPRCEHQPGNLVGKLHGTDEAGNFGHDNQKGKYGHQYRQRDMAGNRPSVIVVEKQQKSSWPSKEKWPRARDRAMLVGVGLDEARIDSKPRPPSCIR